MSIRPVDLQVLIPRATEVGRVQQMVDQQNTLQQQQFAEQWQQISVSRQKKVQGTPKTVDGKIRREKEKEGTKDHSGYGKQSNSHSSDHDKQQGESSQNSVDPNRGRLIDIIT